MSHADLVGIWMARIRPFWRLHPEIYEMLADRFLRLGDLFSTVDCAREGVELCGDRPLLVYRQALGLARLGARGQAEQLIDEHSEVLADLPDFRPLIARLHKDAWIATRDDESLRRARDEYAAAAAEPRDDVYYPAVNAATLSVFMGDDEGAARFGAMVREDLAGRSEMNYWELASLAEAELAAGKLEAAKDAYRKAVACGPSADQLGATRDQASLLLERLGFDRDELSEILGRALVVCITGHIVDRSDRASPRFPDESVPKVKEAFPVLFGQLGPTAAVVGGAAGADLLACEALQAMNVSATVILPMRSEPYAAESVSPSGPAWEAHFQQVLSASERVLDFPAREPDADGRLWEFGNELLLGHARQQALAARGAWEVIAVWDGKMGDGAGGTQDLILRAHEMGASVHVIDPMDGTTREWHADGGRKSSGGLRCRWIVHLEGRSREVIWSSLGMESLKESASRAVDRVELGSQARFEFDSFPACAGFLEALDTGGGTASCGVGVAVGPALRDVEPGGEPEFFADAAELARSALKTGSLFATWESAALAALFDPAGVAFEFAGRTGLQGDRAVPFYTVAIRRESRG